MLIFIPKYYKNQQIYDKTVDNYSHEYAPACYKTHTICNKNIKMQILIIFKDNLFLDALRFRKMCDKAVNTCLVVSYSVDSKELFMLNY